MIKGSKFSHPKTGGDIKVRGRITCNTKYGVYLLKCRKTKRELKTRICENKCAICNLDVKSSVCETL